MLERKTERVSLSVLNEPGVLVRVTSHIRREGWNIKRLFVDEVEDGAISEMEIDIEGAHSKLALVVERLLSVDCVMSVTMTKNGRATTRTKESAPLPHAPHTAEKPLPSPEKRPGAFRVLTVNPGSTSTKFALYDDEEELLSRTVRHEPAALRGFPTIFSQKDMRKQSILSFLREAAIPLSTVDAVAGRGGLLKPVESGTYLINGPMLRDLSSATASVHASALGAVIAAEIAEEIGVSAYVVDPIVVDEMDRNAKLTGMPGVERSSVFHALNQKAVARRLAAELGLQYENMRLVVAHLGGGITVGAHRYGRVIDVNDALSGEGPFTPERAGAVPALSIVRMCYSGEFSEEEMADKIVKNGGMQAYLGTSDLKKVQHMINNGDEFAALVLDSMAYQVSKEIGAMCAALEGRVEAIVLTGGLAHSTRFTGAIKQRVDAFAPLFVFPGEDETLALMSGVLRVLRGSEQAAVYE